MVNGPMSGSAEPWDYLIVTASNDEQASAYERQLRLRDKLGFLSQVGRVLVVPDPEGRRVGSGGSTICCLLRILQDELAHAPEPLHGRAAWEEVFRRLRILIVHAGGDSKRLPIYGPCGKIFIPVPGEDDSALVTSLFDRQLPTYLALPPGEPNQGQIVVTSGDVLLQFDPGQVRFGFPRHHGPRVLCNSRASQQTRRVLQQRRRRRAPFPAEAFSRRAA